MDWYKTLDINTKIVVKSEIFELACGVSFEKLAFILSFKERINILHQKLISEGILI